MLFPSNEEKTEFSHQRMSAFWRAMEIPAAFGTVFRRSLIFMYLAINQFHIVI